MDDAVGTQTSKNVHIRYYASICDKLKIPYTLDLKTRILRLTSKSGKAVFIYKASTPLNTQSAVTMSKDKREVHRLLEPMGLPVPTQLRIRDIQKDLISFFEQYQQIVIKPADSHGGKGVTVLPNAGELELAFSRARKESNIVLAEQYVAGENYRFLVLDGKVLAVAYRKPPTIVGDGKTLVGTLFEDFNVENKANGIPRVPDKPRTWEIVAKQGYTREDILPIGQELQLRFTANLSLGGTVKDVSRQCHDSYKDLASSAAKALGLRLVGIDIIAEDISTPGKPVFIIEANAAPGLRIHYKCAEGAQLDVATPIISAIYNL